MLCKAGKREKNMTEGQAQLRGYLKCDYRLFHIYDKRAMDFGSHAHDFHKVILCLEGSVTYIIEGRSYVLRPWDILLVPKNKIHHSKTDALCAYERVVLFLSSDFLDRCDGGEKALSRCFLRADTAGTCLLHAGIDVRHELTAAVEEWEKENGSEDYAADILCRSAVLRFLVFINRLSLCEKGEKGEIADRKIDAVIEYIHTHYAEPLTAESIAKEFYISKSYLMHRFKTVTGGSLHGYVTQKRLSAALSLLRDGVPATAAARECGFSDYTVFYRSFRKQYGFSPVRARTTGT